MCKDLVNFHWKAAIASCLHTAEKGPCSVLKQWSPCRCFQSIVRISLANYSLLGLIPQGHVHPSKLVQSNDVQLTLEQRHVHGGGSGEKRLRVNSHYRVFHCTGSSVAGCSAGQCYARFSASDNFFP